MKTKKTIFSLSLATALLFSTVSCDSSGPDSTTSKTYDISDFSRLKLEVVGKVIYEQSDSSYLNVTGSTTLIEGLKVIDDKGELTIELKNKRKFSKGKKKLTVHVGSPGLHSVEFKSVGSFFLKNNFQGDKLSIFNDGVGEITVEDCNVGEFNLVSKSVGSIEISGTSTETYIDSEGVGDIDCSKFKSKNVKVISKGVGSLSVYAQESIDVSLKGIGNVDFYGNPASVESEISGLGKVNRKD